MVAVVALNTGLLVFPRGLVYHWYDSDVPVATTLSCAELPNVIVEPLGWLVICGALHEEVTVTVAVLLFAPVALQEFITFTQYDVVTDGETWIEAVVPPPMGDDVSPAVPTYH